MRLTVLLLFVLASGLSAQSDPVSLQAFPRQSPYELARSYLYRQWTDEQADYLKGRLTELEMAVDTTGRARLLSATDIDRLDIIDTLRAVTATLPPFRLTKSPDSAGATNFHFWLSFPDYGTDEYSTSTYDIFTSSHEPLTADLLRDRYAHLSDQAFLDINASYAHHYGTVGSYLKDGGGFDLLVGGNWNDRWGAGVFMAVEITGRHRPFPEDRFPERSRETSGGFGVGGMLQFSPYTGRRLRVSLRPELGYGLLNAANRLDPDGQEGLVQYRGAHFGLVAQATLRFGDYRPRINYGREEVAAGYSAINIFAGIRHRHYGDRVGTGTFLVAGVGYRFGNSTFERKIE